MLRHSDKPTPEWLIICAGPLLVAFGVFGVLSGTIIDPDQPILNAIATVIVGVILALAGISLTKEFTWPSVKRLLRPRRDQED